MEIGASNWFVRTKLIARQMANAPTPPLSASWTWAKFFFFEYVGDTGGGEGGGHSPEAGATGCSGNNLIIICMCMPAENLKACHRVSSLQISMLHNFAWHLTAHTHAHSHPWTSTWARWRPSRRDTRVACQ